MKQPAHCLVRILAQLSPVALSLAACGGTGLPTGELGQASQELASCTAQPLAISAVVSSSDQAASFTAPKAIDGKMDSRWSSKTGSPTQWLRLDLGARKSIASVVIEWETAFSPDYEIQISDNATNWAPARRIVTTTGGHQEITGIDAGARYVRVFANKMSGYDSVSIREVKVLGDANTSCDTVGGQSVRLPVVATLASTTEFSYTPASAVVDGIYSTRWSSQWIDNQWIAMDLGAAARVDRVRITWESSYAKSYTIDAGPSINGPWTTVATNTAGVGGVENVAVNATTRYLRLNGVQRSGGYGISVWELDVYGSKEAGVNLLTRGWNAAGVSSNFGLPTGTYAFDTATPANVNFINVFPGLYEACTDGNGPARIWFTQSVTVPEAGTKFHLKLDISNVVWDQVMSDQVCVGALFNGVDAATVVPNPSYDVWTGTTVGCVQAGPGTIEADFTTTVAAGSTVNLAINTSPMGPSYGPYSNCGANWRHFWIANASLVKTQ